MLQNIETTHTLSCAFFILFADFSSGSCHDVIEHGHLKLEAFLTICLHFTGGFLQDVWRVSLIEICGQSVEIAFVGSDCDSTQNFIKLWLKHNLM